MRVKVSPDYEGAGSWETDAVWIAGRWRDESTHVEYPASWCKPIPEITPEPGDICESYDNNEIFVLDRYEDGKWWIAGGDGYWRGCRVLARKPMGYEEAWKAILEFVNVWDTSAPVDRKQAAYERFLSAILGVPYARVGE